MFLSPIILESLSVFNFFFLSFAVACDTWVPGFADIEVSSLALEEMYSIRAPAYMSILPLYLQAWLLVAGVTNILVPILFSKFDFLPNSGYVDLVLMKLFFVTKIDSSRHFLLLITGESVFSYIIQFTQRRMFLKSMLQKARCPPFKIDIAKFREI